MKHTSETIREIIEKQRTFFKTGFTLDLNTRIKFLKELKNAVITSENELEDALATDLGRSNFEAYLCDIGPVIAEINEAIHGLRKWARPETHLSGIMCFPSIFTQIYKVPYGVTLVISPFNFPVLLTLGVLAAAVGGGNTAIIKASSKSSACTATLAKIIANVFPPEYVTVIAGGHDVADLCLSQRFDKIFYTGSTAVAKHILSVAANNITPVALELGGENGNWCIIRKDADIRDAAKKIAFFKLCNSGQICININQIAVADSIADSFIEELKTAFTSMIGNNAFENEEYPRLVTSSAYKRCEDEAEAYRDRIVYGGKGNPEKQKYSPTIIYPVDVNEDIVKHELFNPLLPVVPFKDTDIDCLLEIISGREHPLAMYLFTRDKKWARKVMSSMQFGGGCFNEVCVQLMVRGVPFNGTGHSGMGAYHGEWGFREFTHPQTVLYGSAKFNLSLRNHPYGGKPGEKKLKLLRFLEK